MSGNKVGSSTQSYHLALNFKTEGGERSKGKEGGEEDEEEKEEKEEEKEGKEEDRVTPTCKTTAFNSMAECGPLTLYLLSMICVTNYPNTVLFLSSSM